MKFLPAFDTNFVGSPNSANTILALLIRLSEKTICLLYKRECAVVIYNTQYFIILNSVYISTYHLSGLVWHYIVLPPHGCVCWYSMHEAHCFTVLSMCVFILIQCTKVLRAFSSLHPYHYCLTAVDFVSAIHKEIIFLLPFMTILSIIANSLLFW